MTLYFIKCRDKIKIGISDSFDARLSKLRRENADELIVLKVFHGPADLIEPLEKQLHLDLKSSNHHNEWFYDTPEVQAALVLVDRQFNPESYPENYNEL